MRACAEVASALSQDYEEQAAGSRLLGRPVRREAVTTEHPLIRVHPVTGYKSLFYNPGFVRAIKGVPT